MAKYQKTGVSNCDCSLIKSSSVFGGLRTRSLKVSPQTLLMRVRSFFYSAAFVSVGADKHGIFNKTGNTFVENISIC